MQTALVRFLGPSEYGRYAGFVNAIAFAAIFAKLGSDVQIVRRFALDSWSLACGALLRVFFVVSVLSALVGTAVELLDLTSIFGGASSLAIALGIQTLAVSAILSGAARGLALNVSCEVADGLLRPAAMLLFLLALSWVALPIGYAESVWGFVLSQALASSALLFIIFRFRPLGPSPAAPSDGARSSFSSAQIPIAVATYTLFQFDTQAVLHFIGSSEAGAYNVACSYVRIVIFASLIVTSSASADLARWSTPATRNQWLGCVKRTVTLSISLALPAALLCAIFSEQIMSFASREYSQYAEFLILLALAHVINSVVIPLAHALNMSGNARVNLYGALAAAALSIVGNLIFVPLYGGAAAALVLSVSLAAQCTWTVLAFRKVVRAH